MAIQHFAPKVDKNCWELRHPPPKLLTLQNTSPQYPPHQPKHKAVSTQT